jgi:AP2-like factor (ANT lineage)
VTKHRWTGRFEAHLWDADCDRVGAKPGQRKKGRQVYLGGYASEAEAARAYDVCAIKYWGDAAHLNFDRGEYGEAEVAEIYATPAAALVAKLRRTSSGFARGASRFRGVTRHHQHGRWEARIGRVFGNRYLYLGTFPSEEDAARAYDRAALEHRGPKAVTNFPREEYARSSFGRRR